MSKEANYHAAYYEEKKKKQYLCRNFLDGSTDLWDCETFEGYPYFNFWQIKGDHKTNVLAIAGTTKNLKT